MRKVYPYLTDTDFLKKLYGQHNSTVYTNIIVLDWDERPIENVTAKIISGSVSVNGDSPIRRTANLNVYIEGKEDLYTNIDSLFSINKKIYLEVGLSNSFAAIGEYTDYPIVWFPFGVYIIQNCSLNHSVNGVDLSLTLNDKMCLLNGYAGGTIPAAVNFESVDTLGPDGDLHSEYIKINQIIPELVNHFGGESLNKILVYDIPNMITQVLRWRGSTPLYIWENSLDYRNTLMTTVQSDVPPGATTDHWNKRTILYNYDCGYSYTEFTFPGELTANAGDTVVTVLDKIKNTLGDFEYFYDVFGNFVFRQVQSFVNVSEWRSMWQYYKNYLNTSQESETAGQLPYLYDRGLDTYTYSFDDLTQIVSVNSNPQFEMIKNDFIVWGEKKSSDNVKYACRYHLAIDDRPVWEEDLEVPFDICFDTCMSDKIRKPYIIKGKYLNLEGLKSDVPTGLVGDYYYIKDENKVYAWVSDMADYQSQLDGYTGIKYEEGYTVPSVNSEPGFVWAKLVKTEGENKDIYFYNGGDQSSEDFSPLTISRNSDWRNLLYWQDFIQAQVNGTETSYYWAEMCNEWPKIYNVQTGTWKEEALNNPVGLDWWLDFIDNNPNLNKYRVSAIGRRSYSTVDNECNCVFEPDIPLLVLINTDEADAKKYDLRVGWKEYLEELGYSVIQVDPDIYKAIMPGGTFNSCYQHIRQLITNYTDYNESINFTCLPNYHLEPNTRIRIVDTDIGIDGDYIINTINFDLSSGGTMSVNCKKCIEKI